MGKWNNEWNQKFYTWNFITYLFKNAKYYTWTYIEIFKKTFEEYPSITKFKIDKQEVLNKMFLKSKIIWYEDKFNTDGGINNVKILY